MMFSDYQSSIKVIHTEINIKVPGMKHNFKLKTLNYAHLLYPYTDYLAESCTPFGFIYTIELQLYSLSKLILWQSWPSTPLWKNIALIETIPSLVKRKINWSNSHLSTMVTKKRIKGCLKRMQQFYMKRGK